MIMQGRSLSFEIAFGTAVGAAVAVVSPVAMTVMLEPVENAKEYVKEKD